MQAGAGGGAVAGASVYIYTCPCPSETPTKSPASSVLPSVLARARTSAAGSTPGESKKKIGVAGPASTKEAARSKPTAAPYRSPSTDAAQLVTARVIRSGRSARTIMSWWKGDSRFHSCGSGSVSDCGCSYHSRQRFCEPSTSAASEAKGSSSASASTAPHEASGSQLASGLVVTGSRGLSISTAG